MLSKIYFISELQIMSDKRGTRFSRLFFTIESLKIFVVNLLVLGSLGFKQIVQLDGNDYTLNS